MTVNESRFDDDKSRGLKQTVRRRRDSLIAPLKKTGPSGDDLFVEPIAVERPALTPIATYDTKKLRRAR
jgi:hypothetical protein